MLAPLLLSVFGFALSSSQISEISPPIVEVDSSRRELSVTVGPFDIPSMTMPLDRMMMDHGATHDTPVQRFEWPVEGWLRGFRFEVLDRNGHPLPRHLMHHVVILNFDRRQLLYSMAERVFGAGSETADASIPRSIGIPFPPHTRMGMYIAWHNDTGKDLDGVRLRLTMQWIPRNQNPRPVDVLPLYMDVNLTVGGTNTFDLPVGRSTRSHEFTLPADGRMLAVSGHLHDYGRVVRLEDAETGRLITQVEPTLDRKGVVTGMRRRIFGIRGDGIRLRAGRRYRVVAEYNNTSGAVLRNGGMAHMVALFAPDDIEKLPAIDPADPTYLRDMASLEQRGGDGENHHHR
jgi:hypothetical protein